MFYFDLALLRLELFFGVKGDKELFTFTFTRPMTQVIEKKVVKSAIKSTVSRPRRNGVTSGQGHFGFHVSVRPTCMHYQGQ